MNNQIDLHEEETPVFRAEAGQATFQAADDSPIDVTAHVAEAEGQEEQCGASPPSGSG